MADTTTEHSLDLTDLRTPELIHYILQRNDQRLRTNVPKLTELALKVQAMHADHPKAPNGPAAHLQRIAHKLDNHMMKQEQILLPMLMRRAKGMAGGAVAVMQSEHHELPSDAHPKLVGVLQRRSTVAP